MGIEVTFEKWVLSIKSELSEYSDKELEEFKRHLKNLSLYGAYDEIIKMIENEQFSRNEERISERKNYLLS